MSTSNLFGNTRNLSNTKKLHYNVASSTILSPKIAKSNEFKVDGFQHLQSSSIALSSSFINMNRKINRKLTFPSIINSTPRFCFPNSKSESIFRSPKNNHVSESNSNFFHNLPVIFHLD